MYQRSRSGFTVLELVIVIGLWAMVGLIVFYVVWNLSDTGQYIQNNLANQNDLEQVFANMTIEIRSMAPSALGAYPITTAGTSSLIFFSDVNNDGVSDQVRYFMGTSTINRGIIVATGTPASYPTSSEILTTVISNLIATTTPLFQYFDAQYTGTQNPMTQPVTIANIRTVLVTVLIDVNPGTAPLPTFFSRMITMRNLRSN